MPLQADTAICDTQFGAPKNGTVRSRAYELHARPWLAFSDTIRERVKRDYRYLDQITPA